MSETSPDRRSVARLPGPQSFTVLADDRCYEAKLIDISVAGLQAWVDPVTFDEIRELIDGVRFGTAPPLSITLHWGFFDGRFGASFKDELSASPIVDRVIAAHGDAQAVA